MATTVSAPGKVLMSGGYLVLERPNSGLVVSTTARFYTRVEWIEKPDLQESQKLHIQVNSPQFHTILEYLWDTTLAAESAVVIPLETNELNPYIQFSLEYALSMVLKLDPKQIDCRKQLDITLQADNDFYSQLHHLQQQGKTATRENLAQLPKHLPCPIDANGRAIVAKTGMGSSAALITSLIGALLQFFGLVSLPSASSKANTDTERGGIELVHNLAQLCHCQAQGKIGSGFDISAAAFGSQIYTRFSPSIIQPIIDQQYQFPVERMISCLKKPWDYSADCFRLPGSMDIIMGDICGGSETVSMVKKVISWKSATAGRNPSLWDDLIAANQSMHLSFQQLNDLESKKIDFKSTLNDLSNTKAAIWKTLDCDVAKCLTQLRSAFNEWRRVLRSIGQEAGVPIEPPEQTSVADDTMQLPGVIVSGVPGAGGHDAIFALVVHSSVLPQVANYWERLPNRICPLPLVSQPHGCVVVSDSSYNNRFQV